MWSASRGSATLVASPDAIDDADPKPLDPDDLAARLQGVFDERHPAPVDVEREAFKPDRKADLAFQAAVKLVQQAVTNRDPPGAIGGYLQARGNDAGIAAAKLFAHGAVRAATPHVQAALGAAAAYMPDLKRPEGDDSLMPGTFPGTEDRVRATLRNDAAPEPKRSMLGKIKQMKQRTDQAVRDRAADVTFDLGMRAVKLTAKGAGQALARELLRPEATHAGSEGPRMPGQFPGAPLIRPAEDHHEDAAPAAPGAAAGANEPETRRMPGAYPE
jgi:hypothetical protein